MKKVAKNSLFLAAGHGVSKTALALLFLAVANLLGPVASGELVIGFTLATFLRNFLDFGLQKVATRFASRNPAEAGAFLADALCAKRPLWVLGYAGYACAGAYFSCLSLETFRMALFLLGMGAAQGIDVLVLTRGYLFNGLERMDLEMLATAVRQGAGLLAGVAGLLAGGGLAGVGAGILLGEALALALSRGMLSRLGIRRGSANPEAARQIRSDCAPIALATMAGLAYTYGNAFLLWAILGPSATGLYSGVQRLVVEAQIFPAILTGAVFPLFSRLGRRGADLAGLLDRARRAGLFLLAFGLAGAALVSWRSEWILRTLYWRQPEFWLQAGILSVLAWMLPLFCVNMLLGDLLYALDRERLAVRISIAGCIVSLLANSLLIPCWKLWGACWANVGVEAALAAMNVLAVRSALRARRGADGAS